MKANIEMTNKNKGSRKMIGNVYQSQDRDMTYIVLKLVSCHGLTYEVLSVDPDGSITTFNLQAHEISNSLEFVGTVDEINIAVKVV